MEDKLSYLLYLSKQHDATDIHFTWAHNHLHMQMRALQGLIEIHDSLFDYSFFNYLKFISDLDLANATLPQSGHFTRKYDEVIYYFRFSYICTHNLQTGVLRILNNSRFHNIETLTLQSDIITIFRRWIDKPSGMKILCGATGSGKTTTLHVLLHAIALQHEKNIISLEDPIEIYDEHYLQLQVNEKAGFTYEAGIRQLLRHDPDIIMIGEIRDPHTARMAYRSALTGHAVFTCVHAGSINEGLKRLEELGLSKQMLSETLTSLSVQRLVNKDNGKERTCNYEILEEHHLQSLLAQDNF